MRDEALELLLTLDRAAAEPLWRQMYWQIRERIHQGGLRAGERVPSSRALATSLGVSRNLVLAAYDQLLAEGYLESRPQSGMRVAPGLLHPAPPAPPAPPPAPPAPPGLVDFRAGTPALELIPRATWGRLFQAICRDQGAAPWGYGPPEGHLAVRQSLCGYLGRTRGVRCHPDQIIMTTGAAQAFAIAGELCIRPGDTVLAEDPMAVDIQRRYAALGAQLWPAAVDEHGITLAGLPATLRPRLVHVTPSHQFPLGGVLPIARRLALVQLAQERGSLIIEDDYDSEIRYHGAPVPALQGLAPEQVIYIGTLSKILAPALRLGYMIVPPALVAAARQAKWQTDLHSPALDHLVLAQFIDQGHLDRHIRVVKQAYRRRRDALLAALEAHFPGQHRVWGASTGIHVAVAWPGRHFDAVWLAGQAAQGLRLHPVAQHAIASDHRDKLIFGYGHLSEPQIAEGVARLTRLGLP
ncbi:PLP-dependent aminotransferase family protein [Chloroflexia bacterium SDU3-3]|nr:PLP-dependent aminotransferase family protein [Chloroflexia bacterium SDU3-3]